jgi:hypothetical protein
MGVRFLIKITMPRKTAAVIIALVGMIADCGVATFGSAQPIQYAVADHHVRVAVRMPPLQQGFDRLRDAYFDAEAVIGGGICTSGDLSVTVTEQPRLRIVNWLDVTDGRYGANLEVASRVQAKLIDCLPTGDISIGVACDLKASVGPISAPEPIGAAGHCRAGIAPWNPYVPIKVPLPVTLPSMVPIKVSSSSDANGEMHFEFGHWEEDTWVSEGNTRNVPFSVTMSGFDDQSGVAILDGAFGVTPPKRTVRSPAEAVAALRADDPLWDRDIGLGISIRERFFGSTQESGVREGLFNEVLPLRVWGRQRLFLSTFVEYEIFIDRAWVKYLSDEKGERVRVSFGTSRATIWKNARIGPGGPIQSVDISAEVGLPKLNKQSLQFESEVLDFRVIVDACIDYLSIHVDPGNLATKLNDGLVGIASLIERVSIALPDCLSMGTDVGSLKVTARRACPDGVVKDRLSNMTREKNSNLVLDVAKGTFRVVKDTLQFGVPMTVEPAGM